MSEMMKEFITELCVEQLEITQRDYKIYPEWEESLDLLRSEAYYREEAYERGKFQYTDSDDYQNMIYDNKEHIKILMSKIATKIIREENDIYYFSDKLQKEDVIQIITPVLVELFYEYND
jgi:hypothetical protein